MFSSVQCGISMNPFFATDCIIAKNGAHEARWKGEQYLKNRELPEFLLPNQNLQSSSIDNGKILEEEIAHLQETYGDMSEFGKTVELDVERLDLFSTEVSWIETSRELTGENTVQNAAHFVVNDLGDGQMETFEGPDNSFKSADVDNEKTVKSLNGRRTVTRCKHRYIYKRQLQASKEIF